MKCNIESINDTNKDLLRKLLENSNVNFLLGAGASAVPSKKGGKRYPLMSDLLEEIKNNNEIKNYYKKLGIYSDKRENINYHIYYLYKKHLFSDKANIEEFFSSVEGVLNLFSDAEFYAELNEQKKIIKQVIKERITDSDEESALEAYNSFYNTLIKINKKSEKTNTRKFNIFTTNYDMLNEGSMENLKLYYYAGFHGIYKRSFNMAYYNYSYTDTVDLYGKKYYEKTDYINLYKLHGSLSWKEQNGDLIETDYISNNDPVIIYPSMIKYNLTTLIVFYQALLREFAAQLNKPTSSLFAIGTSLGDEHLLKIIESALDLECFNLVIFKYGEIDEGSKIDKLSTRENVYVFYGDKCTLEAIYDLYVGSDL